MKKVQNKINLRQKEEINMNLSEISKKLDMLANKYAEVNGKFTIAEAK